MATIIYPNGKTLEVVPLEGEAFSLEYLQELVAGNIEMVRLFDGSLMILNENGKLEHLRYNHEASIRFNTGGRLWTDVIMGTVIICTPVEAGEGDDGDADTLDYRDGQFDEQDHDDEGGN